MLDKYDGFTTLYAKLTLTISQLTLEVRPTGRGAGIGVFACEDIPEDTFIMTFAGAGPLIPHTCGFQHENQFQVSTTHTMICANLAARFINHSCDPNCGHLQGTELYSIRRIRAGEELAYDYSCSMAGDNESFACHCGSRWCRGTIGNFIDIADEWRKRYYLSAGLASPHCLTEPLKLGPTVADVDRGDRLTIRRDGAAPTEIEVKNVLRVNAAGESRTELTGRSARGKVFLEWQEDSPYFGVSFDETRSLDAIGLTESDLPTLAERLSGEQAIELDGRSYRYCHGGRVRTFDERRGKREDFLAWEFEAEDGSGSFTIEHRPGEPPEISIGEYVAAPTVEVHLRRSARKAGSGRGEKRRKAKRKRNGR